jgi:hypothetical protein
MEVLLRAFPESLQYDVSHVIRTLPFDSFTVMFNGQRVAIRSFLSDNFITVSLNGEALQIPYRVYFNEPNPVIEASMTETQKMILNCLLLRHHNGFVREKRLRMLADKTETFIIPFTIELLGEYVLEIIEVLPQHINKNFEGYGDYIKENPARWNKIWNRIISYWDLRHKIAFPKWHSYPGYHILQILRRTHNTGLPK